MATERRGLGILGDGRYTVSFPSSPKCLQGRKPAMNKPICFAESAEFSELGEARCP